VLMLMGGAIEQLHDHRNVGTGGRA
jgi:hypothetical protein